MAHRKEDTEQRTDQVTVHLADVEPFGGLIAATARFCMALGVGGFDAATLPEPAMEALAQMQAILWRLEHSSPETLP